MKYEKHSFVQIKEELIDRKKYGKYAYRSETMSTKLGCIVQILDVCNKGYIIDSTTIKWTDEMIDGEVRVANLSDEIDKENEALSTKHYNFEYKLTKEDIANGFIKLDPYFVSDTIKLGERDNSGIIFHILKNAMRYGLKETNNREREVNGIVASAKRMFGLRGWKWKH